MIRTAATTLLVILVFAACNKEPQQEKVFEVYAGDLVVRKCVDAPGVACTTSTDKVTFTVDGTNYDLEHVTRNSNLCNSEGRIVNFGGDWFKLTPDRIQHTGNCDSLRVPSGQFRTDFDGDSLRAGPDTSAIVWYSTIPTNPEDSQKHTDTVIYTFRLTR